MKKLTKKINEIVMLMELQALNNLDRKTGEQTKTIKYNKEGFNLSVKFVFWTTYIENDNDTKITTEITTEQILKYTIYAFLKIENENYDISNLI